MKKNQFYHNNDAITMNIKAITTDGQGFKKKATATCEIAVKKCKDEKMQKSFATKWSSMTPEAQKREAKE